MLRTYSPPQRTGWTKDLIIGKWYCEPTECEQADAWKRWRSGPIQSTAVWDGHVITEGCLRSAISACPCPGGGREAAYITCLWVTAPPGPVPWEALCNYQDLTFSHQDHTEVMPEQSQGRHLMSRCSQRGVMGKQNPDGILHKPVKYWGHSFSFFSF